MPLFDFHCTECEHSFEELVRSEREEKSIRCARCGSEKVEKLLSVFATGSSGGSSQAKPSSAPGRKLGGCGPSCGCHH